MERQVIMQMFGCKQITLIGAALSILMPTAVSAQMTAFKTGEETSGGVKRCYYESAGKRYVMSISPHKICPQSAQVGYSGGGSYYTPRSSSGTTAFKTGENITGGVKQCFYEALGRRYVKTIPSYGLCPLSVVVSS